MGSDLAGLKEKKATKNIINKKSMKKILSLFGILGLMLTAGVARADNTVDRTSDDSVAEISSDVSKSTTNNADVNVDVTNRYDGRLRANISSNSGLNAFIADGDIERTTNETGSAETGFSSSVKANDIAADVWVEQDSCNCENSGRTGKNSISGTSDDSWATIDETIDEEKSNDLTFNANTSNDASDDSEITLASNTGGNLFEAGNDIEDVRSRTGSPSTTGSLSREFNRVTAVFTVKQR